MSGDIFVEEGCAATGIWWIEAKDITKHPVMHRTAFRAKNYLVQNDNSAHVEKPYS